MHLLHLAWYGQHWAELNHGRDWGAPTAETEAAFDRVWQKPICRGQQAIQPSDFPWSKLYGKLYQNQSSYCEVYAPSFLGKNRDALAEEIRKFAEHCRKNKGITE